MDRQPVVAGQFYPGNQAQLSEMVESYLRAARGEMEEQAILCMVPHAGYVFSGQLAGTTLGQVKLAPTVVLLGPNHSGRGENMAVWNSGEWRIPGASLAVDEQLAQTLLEKGDLYKADTAAHIQEHSLEVMLPFLYAKNPQTRILPISVSEQRIENLRRAGVALAETVKAHADPVTILVSSDMSHYISHEQARERDSLALEKALALDPEGMYETVVRKRISMCGVLPMTLGLYAARELGARNAKLVGYTTSGEISGDYAQVVGYAGLVVS